MADVSDLSAKIPLDELLSRRYFRLKHYLDDFLNEVETHNLNSDEYIVVVKVEKK